MKYKMVLKDKEKLDSLEISEIEKSWDKLLKAKDILGELKDKIPSNLESRYKVIMTLLHISDEKFQEFINFIKNL